jgi:hypothetical protein
VDATKPSFFRVLIRQILSSAPAARGGYLFDLHGRWRYRDPPPPPVKCVQVCEPPVMEILSAARM